MGNSCIEVCELMIELVCAGCLTRETCVDADEDVSGNTSFHDQLLECISQHVKVRTWLSFNNADLIGMFENLKEQGTLYGKIPEGFEIKDHLEELKAELKIQAMITWVNEELWDQVQYFMEEYPHE